MLRKHYSHLIDKPFFPNIEKFMLSSEVWVAVIEGDQGTVGRIRDIVGATDPRRAKPGTVRHRYGKVVGDEIFNVVHASESQEAAFEEIRRLFLEEEIRNAIPEIADVIYGAK
jgi:nucleoside-diphosphate kinase